MPFMDVELLIAQDYLSAIIVNDEDNFGVPLPKQTGDDRCEKFNALTTNKIPEITAICYA